MNFYLSFITVNLRFYEIEKINVFLGESNFQPSIFLFHGVDVKPPIILPNYVRNNNKVFGIF
jgi:hypothetical protein